VTVPVFTGVWAEMSRADRVTRQAEDKTEQPRARGAIDELVAAGALGGDVGDVRAGPERTDATRGAGRGQLYLIDASAHARSQHTMVRAIIAGLIADRAAATCVTVDLEAGYSGRDLRDVRTIAERRRELYVVLPISEVIADRARDVQVRMAARGHHRAAGVIDLLTAAVAEHHGAVLLHYDADFEHVAATTGQAHAWIAPRGTLP
jgi:predicted nucleic acid-binding protein